MTAKGTEGQTVLLVNSAAVNLPRIRQLLAGAGHLPIVAQTLTDAVALTHDYPIDVVLLPSDLLGDDWAGLKKLTADANRGARVLVLCERVRRNERRMGEAYGVTVVTCQRDSEAELLSAFASATETPAPEYAL